jgi:hypothetical protein
MAGRYWRAAVLIVLILGIVLGTLLVEQSLAVPRCPSSTASAACTRVLFVGNSYTSVNDLPAMFARLAHSSGRQIDSEGLTQDGSTLADHAAAGSTWTALHSEPWDYVVLQEQSEIPSVEALRKQQMYPAARRLVIDVQDVGAQPLFFLTWAHRDGWPENGLPDYRSMQTSIDEAYLTIAREEQGIIAPVGVAWETLASGGASSGLWQADGSHPTTKGTYLAACVFYATIFRQRPKGLTYHAGLSDQDALTLQETAAQTVLSDPSTWRFVAGG